ncbi:hypothetical protein [Synechocystis sp. PCC 7509]|nr:hypothetical protein [Synechocystis sp. PCC 7509]
MANLYSYDLRQKAIISRILSELELGDRPQVALWAHGNLARHSI